MIRRPPRSTLFPTRRSSDLLTTATITGGGDLTLDSSSPLTLTSGGTLSNNRITNNGAFNWSGTGTSTFATTENVNGGLAITQSGQKRLYGTLAPASNPTWDR